MKLSVIIPNYNNDKYIIKCLESLKIQTFKDFEIIVVDDGSTDNSVEVINNFINENKDIKIILIKQYNQNASVARNRGIEIAKGEYLYFLDSDDEVYNENIFQIISDKIDETHFDLLFGNYVIVDEFGKNIKDYHIEAEMKDFENKYSYSNVSPMPSNKVYKKELLEKYNIYFANCRIGQDLNFFLKYLAVAKKIEYINEKFYKYRILESSMSRVKNLNFLDINTSISDVKKFYYNNELINDYDNFVSFVCLKHLSIELMKVQFNSSRKYKKMVYSYFDYCVIFNEPNNRSAYYERALTKYKIKKMLLKLHLFNFYKKHLDKK